MKVEALVCQFEECKMILQNPITLPCGESLCLKHLESFNDQFKCFLCDEEHQMPKNGFKINKTINLLLENYFESNPLRNEIRESFNRLNQLICDYETLDPEGYIFDYIRELINRVDLHREELLKEINDKSDQIIKQLKDKEQICMANVSKLQKMNLDEFKTDNLPLWEHSLRKPDINEDNLYDLLEKMNDKIGEIQNEIQKFKSDLLINEAIDFEEYEKSSLFGTLSFYSSKYYDLLKNSGKLITSYNAHSQVIGSIEVIESNRRIISSSEDSTIKIWDFDTGECLKTLEDHQNEVTCILIIPNDKFISGSYDNTIKIWDLNSYECLNTLTNESVVGSLCLLPNNQIACGCGDGSISIWDLNFLTKLKSFVAHDDFIPYLLVDETVLLSCSGDKKIKIWNSSQSFELVKELEGHSEAILDLELTSDGKLLSWSWDKTVKLWQIDTGEILKSFEFEDQIACFKILNDDLILVSLQNGDIQIYDFNKMETIKIISREDESCISCFRLLSNGNLLTGCYNGEINLWKILQ